MSCSMRSSGWSYSAARSAAAPPRLPASRRTSKNRPATPLRPWYWPVVRFSSTVSWAKARKTTCSGTAMRCPRSESQGGALGIPASLQLHQALVPARGEHRLAVVLDPGVRLEALVDEDADD